VTVVSRGQPIKTVADSRAKTVGVLSLAAGTVPTLKAMLAKPHRSGLEFSSSRPAQTAAMVALKSGRVDAYSISIGAIAGLENMA